MVSRALVLCCVLWMSSLFSVAAVAQNDEAQQFTLSGKVYSNDGNVANRTSIKVDQLASVWSDDDQNSSDFGEYRFEGITEGEHTVRAYFMNDGHSVVYRKMFFTSNAELDWYAGKNWVTIQMYDDRGEHVSESGQSVVELLEIAESKHLENGRSEFGPLDIGQYFTIRASFRDVDQSSQYVHFKMESGSASWPDANDFDFHHGKNSRYGFILDEEGLPLPGVSVRTGSMEVVTNSDGFYLLQNLDVDMIHTITFEQSGIEVLSPIDEMVTEGPGWLNLSSSVEVELPENVTFTENLRTISMSPITLQWQGGAFTDFFSLYEGDVTEENLVYRGASESFTYTPVGSGTLDFFITATNMNGTTVNPHSMMVIVLPGQTTDELWSTGMNWDYEVRYAPSNTIRNITLTMIGSETISDSFGHQRDTFLTRISGTHFLPDEKSYRWVDVEDLLTVHSYWADDPSSSSYYQEGILGWNFTDENGDSSNLLSSHEPLSLHFNRTNIIGVPGHPNGYDDTFNSVVINNDVEITTAAGTFSTKHIVITDESDGIASWQLWYNDSVRNWVKIIDQLPGSHSDSVEYELTSYEHPTTPQFITENAALNVRDFAVEWAVFEGASAYQLVENGVIIYQGNATTFSINQRVDGEYLYGLNAVVNGDVIIGSTVKISVLFVTPVPEIRTSSQAIYFRDSITVTWSPIENAEWYSVLMEDEGGVVTEVYNGTSNSANLENLPTGLNRIRVKTMVDGIPSDLSDSVFITVDGPAIIPASGSDNSVPGISFALSLMVFLSSAYVSSFRRRH